MKSVFSLIILCTLLLSSSCKNQPADSLRLEVSGLIEAIKVDIRSKVLAEVEQVLVREGQRVEKGDLL